MIEIVRHIKRMRGGSQPHLMSDSESRLWVVKFANNAQHKSILANELLASRLAASVGLKVPDCAVVRVSKQLIRETPDLVTEFRTGAVPCSSGYQFGSRYVGCDLLTPVRDYLNVEEFDEVENLNQFAGVLAFDKWAENADGRQVLFVRKDLTKLYTAVFIDFGYCFQLGEWRFEDAWRASWSPTMRGAYPRDEVYSKVITWESFDPWLTRLEHLDPSLVEGFAEAIPKDWYDRRNGDLKELARTLLERRSRVRGFIQDFARSRRTAFVNWSELASTRRPVRERQQSGTRVLSSLLLLLGLTVSHVLTSGCLQ